jgi:hypothetical protein
MNSSRTVVLLISLVIGGCVACARPPEDASASDSSGAVPRSKPPEKPAPTASPVVGRLNYPDYSPEFEKESKALKGGVWIPIEIYRPFVLLHAGGIILPKGKYFVQLLSDSTGNVTRFLLAKKRGTPLNQVNLKTAKAADGSFAEIIEVISNLNFGQDYAESKAFLSGSGESAQIWAHEARRPNEWRGEIMGWGGPEKLTVSQ